MGLYRGALGFNHDKAQLLGLRTEFRHQNRHIARGWVRRRGAVALAAVADPGVVAGCEVVGNHHY